MTIVLVLLQDINHLRNLNITIDRQDNIFYMEQ